MIFEKIPLYYINRNFTLSRPLFSLGSGGDRRIKPVYVFFLPIPWQPLVELFSLGNRPHTTKIGLVHKGNE
jgi:hypothetical protein